MVGSLGKLYESIEEMPDKYMQPDVNKEHVLKASDDTSEVFDQMDGDNDTECDDDGDNTDEDSDLADYVYRCRYGCAYVSIDKQVKCTGCGRMSKNTEMKYIESQESEEDAEIGKGEGYVKELVNYMITDNLVVKPMSSISSFTLLSNVKDMSAVESLEVYIGKNEAVNLLKASFMTDKVLSSMFAGHVRSHLQSSRSLFKGPKGSGRNIWRRLWEIRELCSPIHEHSPPPGFTDKGQPSTLIDEDGVITLTPEEQALLLKIRAEKAAEKVKAKVDQVDKEAEARAKKREADALRLKALQLQREEIEMQERTLREAMRADETGRTNKDRRERRAYDEEDESDSDSHP
ncbi:hypothetical protein AgCh_035287 [Apium graveolens]